MKHYIQQQLTIRVCVCVFYYLMQIWCERRVYEGRFTTTTTTTTTKIQVWSQFMKLCEHVGEIGPFNRDVFVLNPYEFTSVQYQPLTHLQLFTEILCPIVFQEKVLSLARTSCRW